VSFLVENRGEDHVGISIEDIAQKRYIAELVDSTKNHVLARVGNYYVLAIWETVGKLLPDLTLYMFSLDGKEVKKFNFTYVDVKKLSSLLSSYLRHVDEEIEKLQRMGTRPERL